MMSPTAPMCIISGLAAFSCGFASTFFSTFSAAFSVLVGSESTFWGLIFAVFVWASLFWQAV